MAEYLSWEAATAPPAPPKPPTPESPPASGGFLSWEAATGAPPPKSLVQKMEGVVSGVASTAARALDTAKPNVPGELAQFVRNTIGPEAQVGTAANLMDMFTGVLGGIYRLPAFAVGSTMARLKGETPEIAAKVGKQFADVIPDEVTRPFSKIAEHLGPEAQRAYENNPAAAVMKYVGEAIQKGSAATERRTGVPAEATEEVVNGIMTLFGVRATRTALRNGASAREALAIQREAKANVDRAAGEAKQVADARVELERQNAAIVEQRAAAFDEMTMTPEKLAALRKENTIRPAEAKQIAETKQAAADTALVNEIFQKGTVRPVEPKGVIPETPLIGEVVKPLLPPEAMAAIEKPAAARGAEDRLALQRIAEESPLVGPDGQPIRSGQGSASPELRSALAKVEESPQKIVLPGEAETIRAAGRETGILDRDGKPLRSERGAADPELLAHIALWGVSIAALPAVMSVLLDKRVTWSDLGEAAKKKYEDLLVPTPGPIKVPEDTIEQFARRGGAGGFMAYTPGAVGDSELGGAAALTAAAGITAGALRGRGAAARVTAGAAAGALLGTAADKPMTGAVLGALGVPAFAHFKTEGLGRGLDKVLGMVSTRLENAGGAALLRRATDFELALRKNTDAALERVTPLLKELKGLSGEAAQVAKVALLSGDAGAIAEAFKGKPKLVEAWRETQKLLDEYETKLKGLGRFKEGITDYFPRMVEDLDGLKKAIGVEQRSRLENILIEAEAKMAKEQQRGLIDVERSLIVNRVLNAGDAPAHLQGFARSRKLEMTKELEPFYASPVDSLLRYVSAATLDLEKSKFYGRNLSQSKIEGRMAINDDASIGNVVQELQRSGRLKEGAADEIRSLLRSRFEGGEQAMNGGLQDVRNLTNAGLLGSFHAAATQIGDSIMTLRHQDLLPTFKAIKERLTGDAQVTPKQFALVNHIAEELGSTRSTGKVLQGIFKVSGFSLIDRFAKGLNLNAALNKYQTQTRSVKGMEMLEKKWGDAFGAEFPQLLEDLKARRVTDRVESLLFADLSKVQPITKLEVPQAYLDHPNGRLLYQMRTYMLKQMDIIRRDAFQEIAKGNSEGYVKGAKALLGMSLALSLSNIPGDVVKEWLSGRSFDLGKIDYVENLLKTFGINRYAMDKIGQGRLKDTAVNTVSPAAGMLLDAGRDLATASPKALKLIPLVGRSAYDIAGGGNDAKTILEATRRRREARERLEAANPAARAERLLREQRRRDSLLERARQSVGQ